MRLIQRALTFDDVLLVPSHSSVLPRDVSLKTRLTRNISLNMPLVSAAMDTVTESRLAIALAQEGGIGFIHKNMSIERQAEEVRRVKKHESGVVTDPQTVLPTTTLREVKELTERNGFAGYPGVTEDNELVGIITGRDMRGVDDYQNVRVQIQHPVQRTRQQLRRQQPVRLIMTRRSPGNHPRIQFQYAGQGRDKEQFRIVPGDFQIGLREDL